MIIQFTRVSGEETPFHTRLEIPVEITEGVLDMDAASAPLHHAACCGAAGGDFGEPLNNVVPTLHLVMFTERSVDVESRRAQVAPNVAVSTPIYV